MNRVLLHSPARAGARGRLSLLALAAALAGCAGALPRLPQQVPAQWQHAPAQGASAPDLRGWWKAFDDAELDRLVDAALADNLTIRQAALRIDAARRLAGNAYKRFLPLLSAHTYAEPTPGSTASYFQAGFDATWEAPLFGRAESQNRLAAANLGLADGDAQAARVSVVAEVVRGYLELRAAQQRLGLLEQAEAAARARIALLETRLRLRLASANELAQAQAEQAGARAALAEPRLAIERSLQQLGVLLGQERADAGLRAAAAPPALGALRIAAAPADLLRTRPEIRRAEYDVLKAAGELGLARADRFPRIGLGGSLTYSWKIIGHSRLSDSDKVVTFGPAIEMPLFDWGQRQAIADARAAELSASVLAYRQAVLEGVAEVETALATLEHQSERALALARALDAREEVDRRTATLGRLGLADDLARTEATAALLEARLETVAAEQARSLAFVALYKALGGAPLPADDAEPAPARGAAAPSAARDAR